MAEMFSKMNFQIVLTKSVGEDDNDLRMGGATQPLLRLGDDALGGGCCSWCEADTETDALTQNRVGNRNGSSLGDARVLSNRVLNLGGSDLFVSQLARWYATCYSRSHRHG
jgi:hypothetical protein